MAQKLDDIKKTIDRIKNINNKILSKSLEEKEDFFFKNFPDIMNKYPFLVSQICSGQNLKTLDYMLNSLEQIENGNISKDNMDKIVGEKLVDEYVKPIADETPNDVSN